MTRAYIYYEPREVERIKELHRDYKAGILEVDRESDCWKTIAHILNMEYHGGLEIRTAGGVRDRFYEPKRRKKKDDVVPMSRKVSFTVTDLRSTHQGSWLVTCQEAYEKFMKGFITKDQLLNIVESKLPNRVVA